MEQTIEKKKVAILRTKGDILTAKEMNGFVIEQSVINKSEFKNAGLTELFAFMLIEGSDYKVVDCKKIENDDDFFNYTFGMKQHGTITANR